MPRIARGRLWLPALVAALGAAAVLGAAQPPTAVAGARAAAYQQPTHARGTAVTASRPVSVTTAGSGAVARVPERDARRDGCATTDSVSFHGDAPLAAGRLGKEAGDLTLRLDVATGPQGPYLLAPGSHVTLRTPRGAVRLALTAGTCAATAVQRSGDTVSGSGTWAVDPAYTTAAYRPATGTGTFTFSAGTELGAENDWTLALDGALDILQPALSVEIVRSYWGRLGADFAGRTATAAYRLTNTGGGDTYGAHLAAVSSPLSGITAPRFQPVPLGNLAPGESEVVTVHWKIGATPRRGPLLTGREFDTALTVLLPDAVDAGAPADHTVRVVAPLYPPAL